MTDLSRQRPNATKGDPWEIFDSIAILLVDVAQAALPPRERLFLYLGVIINSQQNLSDNLDKLTHSHGVEVSQAQRSLCQSNFDTREINKPVPRPWHNVLLSNSPISTGIWSSFFCFKRVLETSITFPFQHKRDGLFRLCGGLSPSGPGNKVVE